MSIVADAIVPVLSVAAAYVGGRMAGREAGEKRAHKDPIYQMGVIVGEMMLAVNKNRSFVGTPGGSVVSHERKFEMSDGRTVSIKVAEEA